MQGMTEQCRGFFRAMFLVGVSVELEADLPILAPLCAAALADRYTQVWRILDGLERGEEYSDQDLEEALELARLRGAVLL